MDVLGLLLSSEALLCHRLPTLLILKLGISATFLALALKHLTSIRGK